MAKPESQPTEAMSRAKLFPKVTTWEIKEGEGVVTLYIQGCVYAKGAGIDMESAYKDLLMKVAPALSRSVTIARLMGGEL